MSGLGVCFSLLSPVPALRSGSSSLCLFTCEIYCLKARLLGSQSRQPGKHSCLGYELVQLRANPFLGWMHMDVGFVIKSERRNTGVSKDMAGVLQWAGTCRQRALGKSNGHPCPLVPSPLPPYSTTPTSPFGQAAREEGQGGEGNMAPCHLRRAQVCIQEGCREDFCSPSCFHPTSWPSQPLSAGWSLSSGACLISDSVQIVQTWCPPALLLLYVPMGVTRWALWSSILQLGVCRSVVGGDVHNSVQRNQWPPFWPKGGECREVLGARDGDNNV